MTSICVLGGGIIGACSALELQSQFPSSNIIIIADKFHDETTSAGAAGIFRPGSGFKISDQPVQVTRKVIEDSYNFYNDLWRSPEADRAGVMQVSGYIFSSKYPSIVKNEFLEKLLPIYRPATSEELQLCPGIWKYGCFSTTLVTTSTQFIPWAFEKFTNGGGQIKHCKSLSSFHEIDSKFDYIINCTGFGSKWLCKDDNMVPIRGQVIKVQAPWIKMFYYGDYDTYIVPGRGQVTLGGCRNYDSYDESLNPHDSKSIWERCTSLVPSLKTAKVIREWVGLRPYREGGVRCNFELIRNPGSNRDIKVIHNYGHGGYGVTSAPGSARMAVEILKEAQRSGKTYNFYNKSKL